MTSPLRAAARDKYSGTPLVSVVIPCYNYARYLGDAVRSVLDQTGVEVEVIIVDDASTDCSLDVARRISANDQRIIVISHERNCGPVKTFNDGLEWVRGEFLVRLDADDLLTPGSLARSIALMRAYPHVGMVYGRPLHFTGQKLPRPRSKARSWTIWQGTSWLRDRCQDGWCVITSPEVLMRSSVVRVVGGQKELPHTHDMEMWMRISAHSDVGYIHGADQAWHRDHPQSLSASKVDTFRDLQERKLAFDVLFEGLPMDFCARDSLRTSVNLALASQAVEFATRELDRRTGNTRLVEAYANFASGLVPSLSTVRDGEALQKALMIGDFRPSFRLSALQRRALRWWRHHVRLHKWRRDGVY